MTVAELIKELEKQPKDMEVTILRDSMMLLLNMDVLKVLKGFIKTGRLVVTKKKNGWW